MKKTRDFIPDNYKEKMIIVYGASSYGEIVYELLKNSGLIPDYYCDRSYPGDSFKGVPLIRPNQIELYRDSACVIIATADFFHEVFDFLDKHNMKYICDMQWLIENASIDGKALSKRGRDIYQNIENYLDVINQEQDKINFTRIQFVVSERCSLRCRDCTHLMQYYAHPENIDLEMYKPAFDRLLSVTDNISELRILGGEPFINPQMYKIIEWYQDNPKIMNFRIYTNGTIVPKEKTLKHLARKKVQVRISDYEINREAIAKLVDTLKEYAVSFYITPYSDWQDAGDLRERGYDKEKMRDIFSKCYERNCITFYRGQLHRCPRSAHAMRLGAMPKIKDDYIDFNDDDMTDVQLEDQIRKLQSRDYIQACNYCDGPNRNTQHIEAAIQLSRPKEYTKLY